MLRHFVLLLPVFIAAPSFGTEIDCPLEDPENPGSRLVGAHPRYGGGDQGQFAQETRRGDISHATDWAEKGQEQNGELVCSYGNAQAPGRKIILKIPGRAVRCDWLTQDVLRPQPVEPGTGGPTDTRFLRVWCTSRP
jgi:hypothetical protein